MAYELKSYKFAVQFEAAAKAGDVKAHARLGDWYDNGHGIDAVDAKTASAHYRKGAELAGEVCASFEAGVRYRDGVGGVERDLKRAATTFQSAAKLGYADAQLHYGHCVGERRGCAGRLPGSAELV